MSDGSAAARWLTVHDEVLRGMAHALSNRIATVSATSYMYETGDVGVTQVMDAVKRESARLEQLLGLLRLLPERTGADAEPATAGEACASAVSLHAQHPEFRDIPCDVVVDPAVYPLWAEPHAFCHALLVALTAAKRRVPEGGRVTIHVSGTADVVQFAVQATPGTDAGNAPTDANDPLAEADACAAGWLLARHGGAARVIPNGCALEVPTLLAARRARKK